MRWRYRARHGRNGNPSQPTNGTEIVRKKREADAALSATKQQSEHVERMVDTLKQIRERDNIARLFKDALGGA